MSPLPGDAPLRVLVIGPADAQRGQLVTALEASGILVHAALHPDGGLPADLDLVLAGHGSGGQDPKGPDGFETLRWLARHEPRCPVVLYDPQPTVETTVRAIHGGAHDLIRWPARPETLLAVVRRASRQRRSGPAPGPRLPDTEATALLGTSAEMVEVFRQVARAARSAVPVLVLGESGTGKELVAKAIHGHGPRGERPLITVNCGALTETLLETELFGHVRGAFTGAERSRPGLFAEADGGTLFLDEIGEISPRLQVQLLRVLQSGEIRPVGADRSRTVDVRVIAATHRDLPGLVGDGRFRQDLYYRLNVMSIRVPPLRDRPEDVAPLVDRFLRQSGRALTLAEDALTVLQSHAWPGNVRELENVIARAAAVSPGPLITLDDLPAELQLDPLETTGTDEGAIRRLSEVEQDYARRILARCHGNKTRAAQLLGIDRKTLGRILSR